MSHQQIHHATYEYLLIHKSNLFLPEDNHLTTASNMQTIKKLEALPNEILIECFEYLNAIDIFNSFDSLNSRFSNLIRTIPLHLNIQYTKQSSLVQFCIKMSLNPQMKTQLRSLKLSKINMCDAVQTFFSFVSLDELPQLRSLTLDDLEDETFSQISSMFPLLTNLRYFRTTDLSFGFHTALSSLPTSTIQTLSIRRLAEDLVLAHPFTSLVNLTLEDCSVEGLCRFLKYSAQLQSLHIERIYRNRLTIAEVCLSDTHAIRLKRLVIYQFEHSFDFLEILLKQTPNLHLLMISARDDIDIVDASRWQSLITTSLPLLKVFKFKFSVRLNDDNDIIDKFQQFQSDFCHQQHQWYTEYVSDNTRALIYTVPYMSNEYQMTPNTTRCYSQSISNVNKFANVTDLTLCPETITDRSEFHFPNVKSLRFAKGCPDDNHAYPFFKTKHIQSLKTIINLCNITHLDISFGCRLKSHSVLLHLVQEMPHLSSLKSTKKILFPLLNNSALSACFSKMIRKLDLTKQSCYSLLNSDELVKLCEIFPHMEEFRCGVNHPDHFLMILNQLSKLSHMKVFSYVTARFATRSYCLEEYISERELYSFTIECAIDSTNNYYDLDRDN